MYFLVAGQIKSWYNVVNRHDLKSNILNLDMASNVGLIINRRQTVVNRREREKMFVYITSLIQLQQLNGSFYT